MKRVKEIDLNRSMQVDRMWIENEERERREHLLLFSDIRPQPTTKTYRGDGTRLHEKWNKMKLNFKDPAMDLVFGGTDLRSKILDEVAGETVGTNDKEAAQEIHEIYEKARKEQEDTALRYRTASSTNKKKQTIKFEDEDVNDGDLDDGFRMVLRT